MGCVGARHRPGQPQRPQRFRRAGFHAENVLGQKLGAGAYASVYAVTQAQGEARRCAAKVVGSGSSGSQTTAEMAAREVEILRKVTETGSNFVVHLIDSFSEDAFTYIVMEMCDHTFLQALRSLGAHTEDTYRHGSVLGARDGPGPPLQRQGRRLVLGRHRLPPPLRPPPVQAAPLDGGGHAPRDPRGLAGALVCAPRARPRGRRAGRGHLHPGGGLGPRALAPVAS
mmetsp:Transcript_29571/g.84317  ORF Transcript_29571/g.84317 Transcript_29571/m.84317 type:complete len:227 (-) Transcript_29571:639-1319(-)